MIPNNLLFNNKISITLYSYDNAQMKSSNIYIIYKLNSIDIYNFMGLEEILSSSLSFFLKKICKTFLKTNFLPFDEGKALSNVNVFCIYKIFVFLRILSKANKIIFELRI